MTKLIPAESNLSIEGKWLRSLVLALILGFYATFLVYHINLPLADDMARHVTNGAQILQGNFKVIYENIYSYTDAGHPFVNHHWLSGVVFYLFHYVIGWSGLSILKAIVYLLAFLLIFLTALRKADFWLVSVLSVPSVLILIERTSLRPEMFSYLLIALYVYLLVDLEEHPERNRIYWLIPLQLLWVNLHIFFSIGLMLVLGFLFSKIVEDYKEFLKNALVRKLAGLFFVMVAVSFINPHGAAGVFYRYPSNFPVSIAENQSLFQYKQISAPADDIAARLFLPFVGLLGASIVFGLWKRRLPLFYAFGAVATAILGFFILRGMYFFGLFFLLSMTAIWSPSFIQLREWVYARAPKYRRAAGSVSVLLLITSLVLGVLPSTTKTLAPFIERGIGLTPQAEDSAEFFKKNNLHGPIFNDPDSGSYLIYNLYPKERVFVDNLFADAYSPEVFEEYLAILAGEDKWKEALAKYNFNTIFFYQYDGGPNLRRFLYNRMMDPLWALVYADRYNYIFVKNSEEHRSLIDRYHITGKNVQERLAHLANSVDFDNQVAFADIANLLGRTDIGIDMFVKILGQWPENAKMWMILGEWELGNQNPKSSFLAAMYLEKAISLGQETAEAYGFLGAAYIKSGQRELGKSALRKSVEINPERIDSKNLLEALRAEEEEAAYNSQ